MSSKAAQLFAALALVLVVGLSNMGAEAMAASSPDAEAAASAAPHLGPRACLSNGVAGAEGELCAVRDRFGARWTLELADTLDDGRPVKATVGLEVSGAGDETATVHNDDGAGSVVRWDGSFNPRYGDALRGLWLETCVVIRFWPDRCATSSVELPQLTAQATPAQAARLEQLAFEMPIEEFMAVWSQPERDGIDASFEWSTDGCSAGPFSGLLGDRRQDPCMRHDFAYRNLGRRFYDPTDDTRRRADQQLATDAVTLGQGWLAPGLSDTLQRFGAPVFFGTHLATAWSLPEYLTRWLPTEEEATPQVD